MLLISTKWNTLHRYHLSQLFAVISHSAHLKEARSKPKFCFPFSSSTEWQLKCWSLHNFYLLMHLCVSHHLACITISLIMFFFYFLKQSINQAFSCTAVCGSTTLCKMTSCTAKQKCVCFLYMFSCSCSCNMCTMHSRYFPPVKCQRLKQQTPAQQIKFVFHLFHNSLVGSDLKWLHHPYYYFWWATPAPMQCF